MKVLETEDRGLCGHFHAINAMVKRSSISPDHAVKCSQEFHPQNPGVKTVKEHLKSAVL